MRLPLSVCALLLVLSACREDSSGPSPLFVQHGPGASGLAFENTIREDSVHNMLDFFYVYNGGGVAVGDINGDGLPDLYFSGNMVSGRLYLNRGGLRFEDITERAGVVTEGWATGVTFVDINHDGHLDLYVCRSGNVPPEHRTNLLYVNNGDLTFTEKAEIYGLADSSHSTQAAFFDYDRDGDLDLFLLNHSNEDLEPNRIHEIVTDGTGIGSDRLYRNDGGTFTDVSVEAGIVYPGLSLGVAVSDLNGDGWEDVYVSNDFMGSDYLYLNNGDGTFSERGSEVFKHYSYAGMGNAVADFNNDGWFDVVVVDMLPPERQQRARMAYPMTYDYFAASLDAGYHAQYWRNTLQVSNGINAEGELSFSEIGQYAGIDATGWSWGPLVADFDGDGYRDLWINNGYRRDVTDMDFIVRHVKLDQQLGEEKAHEQIREWTTELRELGDVDYLFRNRGDLTFENVSRAWGVNESSFSNGGAYADLDNDGDVDVVINNVDAPVSLYENTLDRAAKDFHYLKVVLQGPPKNPFGLGADLRLYCGDRQWRQHQAVSRGYQSSVDYVMHVGLGRCGQVDSLHVSWPDGRIERLSGVAVDQTLHLQYSNAVSTTQSASPRGPEPLLQEASSDTGIRYVHKEAPYNDFARQPLLPHQHSQMGPGVAVGDVDGDGREDFFAGGSYGRPGGLFVQRIDGTFEQRAVREDPQYEEDLGTLFFDADGDGDLDLYVAGGSNEFFDGSEYYQDRLYLNDGRGRFTPAPDALPTMRTSSSSVQAADYDGDGDLDLFVGGRLQPLGRRRPAGYPLPGRSYLLRNDEGRFVDVTEKLAPGLGDRGMVSASLWTDFDGDGRVDLIVTGEFMPLCFYRNTGEGFEDVTQETGLAHATGWWNSLSGGDFDHDGDVDYVVGNLGLNTRYEVSEEEHLTVYAKDFGRNGRISAVLTHYVDGREYPVHSRDDFLEQFRHLSFSYPDYESYAAATLDDLFKPEDLADAYVLRAAYLESSYVENLGDGRFALRPLGGRAQWAPIYGTVVEDIDGDGFLDVLAIGNSYAPDVITGRHGALVGLLLKGDGLGHFEPIDHRQSGFFVDGDGKGLARLTMEGGRRLYLAAQNNGPLKVFRGPAQQEDTFWPEPLDAYALITFSDGSVRRHEFYHGNGYLSQSSRGFALPAGATSVTVVRYDGTERSVAHRDNIH